ncbi:MAG: hypothetical protein ACE5GA_08160 [Candidatus Zixiibacteriota bacterium]
MRGSSEMKPIVSISLTALATLVALAALVLTFGVPASQLQAKEADKKKVAAEEIVKAEKPAKVSRSKKSGADDRSAKASGVPEARPGAGAPETQAAPDPELPQLAPSGVTVTGETISWEVFGGGGGFGTSTNFGLSGTIGEAAVGDGFSTNFGVLGGFEQDFGASTGACCALAGNANGDDKVNIADVSFVIAWLFAAGPSPVCCAEGNANGDDKLNIADVSYVISWLFAAGPDPMCGPAVQTC